MWEYDVVYIEEHVLDPPAFGRKTKVVLPRRMEPDQREMA